MPSDALLLVMQLIVQIICLKTFVLAAITPEIIDSTDPHELYNLLAPPNHVLGVWMSLLMCFDMAITIGPESTVGSFIERYCTPRSGEPMFLSLALLLSGIFGLAWVVLMGLKKRHLAAFAMVAAWCGLLPFYLVLSRCFRVPNTLVGVGIFILGELSVRLYFTWLTGAVIFAVLDEVQRLYGSFFSYIVYAQLMGGILAVALGVYIQGRDPVVALMATWFLVGLANRKCAFDGEIMETFEKLQTTATIVKPVFLVLLIIDVVRSIRHFLDTSIANVEVEPRRNEHVVIAVYGTV